MFAFVAQLADYLFCNQDVVGSIPSEGSHSRNKPCLCHAGILHGRLSVSLLIETGLNEALILTVGKDRHTLTFHEMKVGN